MNAANLGKFVGRLEGVAIDLTKRVEHKGEHTTSWTRVKCGTRTGDVEVYIDVQKLVRAIGDKALRNKNRTSKLQGGAVTLIAINVREERA